MTDMYCTWPVPVRREGRLIAYSIQSKLSDVPWLDDVDHFPALMVATGASCHVTEFLMHQIQRYPHVNGSDMQGCVCLMCMIGGRSRSTVRYRRARCARSSKERVSASSSAVASVRSRIVRARSNKGTASAELPAAM